jgi:phosphate transport system protein
MAEKFHAELTTLRCETAELASQGRNMLRASIDSLIRQDAELALSVINRKDEMRMQEIRLEECCYQLIALNQPVAKDMRVIVSSLKVISASGRVGRYGKVIAKIVGKISDKPHIAKLMSIPHMAELVIDMVDDSIKAYATDDVRGIREFSGRDDVIDALRHSIFREGVTWMIEDPKNIPRCTHYIMIARYLERCADHACKIAENVYYMNTGERIEIH